RRRHTRFSRDWSSDVCSSDLIGDRLVSAVFNPDKEQRLAATDELKQDVIAHFTEAPEGEEPVATVREVSEIFDGLVKGLVRRTIDRKSGVEGKGVDVGLQLSR